MYDMLRMRNERSQQQAVDFAAKLVRAASPSLAEGAVATFVAQEMRRIGYDKVMRDSAGNVVGVMLGMESGRPCCSTATWTR
jgi:putative aminopeptidase FrvX